MDIYEWCVVYLQTHQIHIHAPALDRTHTQKCEFFRYLSIFVYVVAWHFVKLLEQGKFSIIYVMCEGRKTWKKTWENERHGVRDRERANEWEDKMKREYNEADGKK